MDKENLLNETNHPETIQNLNNELQETQLQETQLQETQLQETQLHELQETQLQEELEIERLQETQLHELQEQLQEELEIERLQETQLQEQLQETQLSQLNELQETQLQETQLPQLNEMQKYIFENSNIENELLKTLGKFFNEIDLVFDNIDKQKVSKLQKYLGSLKDSTNLKTFVKETILALETYDKDISYIMTTRNKIKTSEYSFLNNVTLFDNILCFSCFSNENKNTKRSIVKYLYNIYMSVFILNFGLIDNINIDSFTTHLSNFLSGINLDEEVITISSKNKIKQNPKQNVNGSNINLLESLMGNSDIMNLATDLSKDIQDQKIDPMMLLSSIMSGKPNDMIQNLVSNITNKIESKINNGEIDKTMFEQQAKNIINSVQNSNGGIQQLFGNFK